MQEKPTRRSFCRTAAGVGLSLSASAHAAAFGAPPDKTGRVRVGLIGTDGHTNVLLGTIAHL
ncbi:MAG: hypothetical protein HQ526_10940, partial [Actinobacteria bacterium]|nr:hypothetical protein [Actinomycetota bacterium]